MIDNEILKIINQAVIDKAAELDLSGNLLTSLPAEITQLTSLKKLDLSDNQLTSIPAGITQLSNLTELYLSNNQLTSLPAEISQLANLTVLDLRGNRLTEFPTEITQTTSLTELYLSYNQLTSLPAEISQLTSLKKLDLRDNQLTSLPAEISQFTSLTELYLSNNLLTTSPAEISQLANLTVLDLRGNRLTSLPAEISQLTSLTELYLSYNQLTSLPAEISQLTSLTELYLSINRLTEFPTEITQLTSLKKLDLRDNQLTSLPAEISQLTSLTELYLSNNLLTTSPAEISQLASLKKLYLSNNQLTSLPAEITQTTSLTELCLSYNQLTSLPAEISQLTNLTELYLSYNQLTSLPAEISQLISLKKLHLKGNQLASLPAEISQLTSLKKLHLSNNHLASLPAEISQLTNLTELYLSYNRLTSLPVEISQLISLKKLYPKGNPLEIPPIEIVVKGIDSIMNFLSQLYFSTKDFIYEAKLLIVGESGAGKTTLTRKIEDQNYRLKDEDTTKGIDVIKWKFPTDNGRDFRVNIWDFGGQEIYHATHQFFLTKRSLYALVADTRKDDTDFFFWCNIVALLSDNSPLLIVKNEKQNRHREINERQLRGQFTNFKETLATNLATNRGLVEIVDSIKHNIKALPHIGNPLPKTWVKVREILEKNSHRNYISLQEYLDICEDNGFKSRKDKFQLSGYLHDIGVCMHFQQDPVLRKTVILNPKWATNAVYKVLDHSSVIRTHGKFTKSDLEKIWNEDKYTNMQDELLQLMINFKLCYKIPETKGNYIAPQLLTENQPDYDWDEANNLIFRYEYEFMPKGIMSRFIVVMHSMIADKNKVWKSGVILKKDTAWAEVIEYYGKRLIEIRTMGESKKDLNVIITHELDKIHKSFHGLKYNKMIPCNCVACRDSQKPHFYQFTKLKEFISNRQYKIQCQQKPYQMINVLSLITDNLDKKDAGRQRLDDFELTDYPEDWMREKTNSKSISELHYHEGDNYQILSQATALGPGAHAHNINLNQIWNNVGKDIDLNQLAEELSTLRSEAQKVAQKPENMVSIGEIAAAEIEAKNGRGAQVLKHLKKAGQWAIEVSTNIGTTLASEVIKKSMGL